jgi:hypothetical protein
MKRVGFRLAGFISIFLIILVVLSRNDNQNLQDFYGTYTFDELIYLTGLSSSTLDYANKTRSETKYTIEADLFKIVGKDINVEIISPSYIKEDIQADSFPSFEQHILKDNGFKYQYDIKDKNGNKIMWRLYISGKNIFVASYHNSAYDTEFTWDIAKLSR